MSTWDEIKKQDESQRNTLNANTRRDVIEEKINSLNSYIGRYINRAGISPDPNHDNDPDYINAININNDIEILQKNYVTLNNNLINEIKNMSASSDIQNKLEIIAKLQQDIQKLQKELEYAKQDSDIAKTRQETVETPRTNLSFYQGFSGMIGFTKPLYHITIPILIGAGLLFLYLSGLLMNEFFIPNSEQIQMEPDGGIFSVFTDSRFIAVIGGMTLVSVVLIILSMRGYLGKSLR
jgi:hypothetical protein